MVPVSHPRVLLSTATFWFWVQPYNPARCLELALEHRLDLDGVEIWFFVDEDNPLPTLSANHRAFLSGLEIVNLHTDFYDLDWSGRPDFARFADKLAQIKDFAGQAGAHQITIHGDMLMGR